MLVEAAVFTPLCAPCTFDKITSVIGNIARKFNLAAVSVDIIGSDHPFVPLRNRVHFCTMSSSPSAIVTVRSCEVHDLSPTRPSV